jgi:hypothetical protein
MIIIIPVSKTQITIIARNTIRETIGTSGFNTGAYTSEEWWRVWRFTHHSEFHSKHILINKDEMELAAEYSQNNKRLMTY